MKLLKKPQFAACVMVMVLIASLFLGTQISLSRRADRVQDLFYNGMTSSDGKYTRPGIATQISACADSAMGLNAIADKYSDNLEVARLRPFLSEFRIICVESNGSGEKYAINNTFVSYRLMVNTAESLYNALQNVDMEEADASTAKMYYDDLSGARLFVELTSPDYNAEVSAYDKLVNSFPTRLFAGEWRYKQGEWVLESGTEALKWISPDALQIR